MTEKRMTGAEFLAAQEAREQAKREAENAAEAAADKKREEAHDAAQAKRAEEIKRDWYRMAQSAGQRDNVKFLVLARCYSGQIPPSLQGVIDDIKAAKWDHAFVNFRSGRDDVFKNPFKNEEGLVEANGLIGWAPENVPEFKFARSMGGSMQYLIVKWGQP